MADKYNIPSTPVNLSNLNRALKSAMEKGTMRFPNGIGGRVKLQSKASKSSSVDKENTPAKKVTKTKTVTKSAVKKVSFFFSDLFLRRVSDEGRSPQLRKLPQQP